jgi:hypothetical protein
MAQSFLLPSLTVPFVDVFYTRRPFLLRKGQKYRKKNKIYLFQVLSGSLQSIIISQVSIGIRYTEAGALQTGRPSAGGREVSLEISVCREKPLVSSG